VKGGHTGHVEWHVGQVVVDAGQQAFDACHRDLQLGARPCLLRLWKALGNARPRGGLIGFGQRNADQAVLAPDQGAAADWRAEQREAKGVHAGLPFSDFLGRTILHSLPGASPLPVPAAFIFGAVFASNWMHPKLQRLPERSRGQQKS
jgi:hypothetical protein